MNYGRLSLKYYAIIILLDIKTIGSSFHIKLSLKIFIQQHINIYDVKPSPKIFFRRTTTMSSNDGHDSIRYW